MYYQAINEAYSHHFKAYGTYTKKHKNLNGRMFYQSDFDRGNYSIWWCRKDSGEGQWVVGQTETMKECSGLFFSFTDDKCVHHSRGWNKQYWNWHMDLGLTWKKAEDGFAIRCVDASVYTSML